jgi:uncharacterized membrane protein
MQMIKNEIVSSLIMSLIVATLVWFNSPTTADEEGQKTIRSAAVFIKAFLIAFLITFAIFYFVSDSGTDEVIENIIKGKPDF